MTVDGFLATLASAQPPPAFGAVLQALWWDAKDDWDQAHACVDSGESPDDIRVHAYLHRKEGDLGNAAYWYRRIGRSLSDIPLTVERDALLRDLLAAAP